MADPAGQGPPPPGRGGRGRPGAPTSCPFRQPIAEGPAVRCLGGDLVRIPATPTPTPEQAEAVGRTRRVVDDARRMGRGHEVIALSYAAYVVACRDAGAVEPPPLAQWPAVTHRPPTDPAGLPQPPTRRNLS